MKYLKVTVLSFDPQGSEISSFPLPVRPSVLPSARFGNRFFGALNAPFVDRCSSLDGERERSYNPASLASR